jgi:hypothetical protein
MWREVVLMPRYAMHSSRRILICFVSVHKSAKAVQEKRNESDPSWSKLSSQIGPFCVCVSVTYSSVAVDERIRCVI